MEYPHEVISGALFDFMGFLTSDERRIVVGAAYNVAPLLDAFKRWSGLRGLVVDNAAVKDWSKALH